MPKAGSPLGALARERVLVALEALKVVHVALVVALRLVNLLVQLVLPAPAAVALDVGPGVRRARRRAAQPAEGLRRGCQMRGRAGGGGTVAAGGGGGRSRAPTTASKGVVCSERPREGVGHARMHTCSACRA